MATSEVNEPTISSSREYALGGTQTASGNYWASAEPYRSDYGFHGERTLKPVARTQLVSEEIAIYGYHL